MPNGKVVGCISNHRVTYAELRKFKDLPEPDGKGYPEGSPMRSTLYFHMERCSACRRAIEEIVIDPPKNDYVEKPRVQRRTLRFHGGRTKTH